MQGYWNWTIWSMPYPLSSRSHRPISSHFQLQGHFSICSQSLLLPDLHQWYSYTPAGPCRFVWEECNITSYLLDIKNAENKILGNIHWQNSNSLQIFYRIVVALERTVLGWRLKRGWEWDCEQSSLNNVKRCLFTPSS